MQGFFIYCLDLYLYRLKTPLRRRVSFAEPASEGPVSGDRREVKGRKKEKKSGGYEPLVSMSHSSVLFFCHEDKLRWVIVAFFCTIHQRLSKCLLNPFPDIGFVDLHGGPGRAWSEADPSWCPSLTSASSALHKVTLTQPHLLLHSSHSDITILLSLKHTKP